MRSPLLVAPSMKKRKLSSNFAEIKSVIIILRIQGSIEITLGGAQSKFKLLYICHKHCFVQHTEILKEEVKGKDNVLRK